MSLFIKQLHTLDTFKYSFADLKSAWERPKYSGVETIQRFLLLNRKAFDFLGIKAELIMYGNEACLQMITSQYAGCVPMLSPIDGRPCGDLIVGGRFGEDISELLSVLGETLLPEYDDSLPQLTTSLVEPPLYFECCNFIDKWLELERAGWHKFNVEEKIQSHPTSGTQWNKYALRSYDVNNALKYPNRNNSLRSDHEEFRQLLSVLFICFAELGKSSTPHRSKVAYSSKTDRLKAKYHESLCLQPSSEFIVHASDPLVVKEIKPLANIILQNKHTNRHAWRIDFSLFFERYVQYIFKEACKSNGAKTINNPHYSVSVSGTRPRWMLHYLEPDMVVVKDDYQCVVDAKYKSHIFNWNDYSDDLHETFRHDFHQVLAYCSFNSMERKQAMLVYPFGEFLARKVKVTTTLSGSVDEVVMVGLPLNKNYLGETVGKIREMFNF